jgi:hypothetical protein
MGLRGWEEGEAAEEGTAAVLSHGWVGTETVGFQAT